MEAFIGLGFLFVRYKTCEREEARTLDRRLERDQLAKDPQAGPLHRTTNKSKPIL